MEWKVLKTKFVLIYIVASVAMDVSCDEIIPCSEVQCSSFATCLNKTNFVICRCNDGFEGNGLQCKDIDECSRNRDGCHRNANCKNLHGSYSCQCRAGYTGDGFRCDYLDECKLNLDNCNEDAICSNTDTVEGYLCSCKEGFLGNGTHCEDVNECLVKNACPDHSECVNHNGSYECICNPGFISNGTICQDIDECSLDQNICNDNKTCINTHGSYSCVCHHAICSIGLLNANEKSKSILIIGVVTGSIVFAILIIVTMHMIAISRRRKRLLKASKDQIITKDEDKYKALEENVDHADLTFLHVNELQTSSLHNPVPCSESLPSCEGINSRLFEEKTRKIIEHPKEIVSEKTSVIIHSKVKLNLCL